MKIRICNFTISQKVCTANYNIHTGFSWHRLIYMRFKPFTLNNNLHNNKCLTQNLHITTTFRIYVTCLIKGNKREHQIKWHLRYEMSQTILFKGPIIS